MQLDHNKIHQWKGIVEAFVKHYKFNLKTTSNQDQLKWEKMKLEESFKEYA